MSIKHPIIAVTGSSGAGTTTVKRSFEHIFRREKISAAVIEGDSMHKYDRAEMKRVIAEAEARSDCSLPTHFGPQLQR
ncbi:MAG: phosphoribulokinase, partial [Rhodocyclaceae bacterium]|nr:phosphoribulokinase [Rhodocyclaceae bacterium]